MAPASGPPSASSSSPSQSATSKPPLAVVVGGGLVGSLMAIYLARRGWHVAVYEARPDIRRQKTASGRSINLALSTRGISALEGAGVGAGILETLIPMKGRMIHVGEGKLSSQPYGVFGECINSVDRKLMNEHLLSEAEKRANVKLYFEHELVSVDFEGKVVVFKQPGGAQTSVKADFLIGADGAYSRVRRELLRVHRVNFSQHYIPHGYVELTMPPAATPRAGDADSKYRMDPHHLHIWPRQTFMMIALPNVDGSFTVTLFMPWTQFDAIKTEEDLLRFFEATFKDAVPLIGRERLVKDYFANPKGALVSVKCNPYHYKSMAVIIGDASHAMVPFYGQGMNCGFEDCQVLDEILEKHIGKAGTASSTHPTAESLGAALEEYSRTRNPNAEAMCDLAMYNYIEMRSSVTKTSYLLRKAVEKHLHRLFPALVIPLYTMVSFSRIPYAEAMRRFRRQTEWFNWAGWAAAAAAAVGVVTIGVGVARRGAWRWDAVRDAVLRIGS
ncbi:hypothetical protein DFJ73DRAFT_875330 [Zopfochytrium polystomum]|nr:hypothetical protein DFJ73DRAFT_875330 [Zopfochytrium polystomum]